MFVNQSWKVIGREQYINLKSQTKNLKLLKITHFYLVENIKDKEIADALELPPIKIHCSVLAEDSIKRAIQDWEEKKAGRNETWLEKMTIKED